MTVLMFALVTAHFVAVNRYTFREFIDDRTPENWARVGDSTQVQSITTEVINVRLVVSCMSANIT